VNLSRQTWRCPAKNLLIAALFHMSNADRFEFPPVNLNSVLGFEYYDLRVLPLPDRLA
jgi:hypothetical protein